MNQSLELPQLPWQGGRDLRLDLPPAWEVEICHMRGHDRPALKAAQIRQLMREPAGCPPIREAARGKQQVVIIFDDIQRATRIQDVLPAVLEELGAAGIRDEQVRLIAATGCHAAMDRFDFVNKLGEETLHRFPVYSHNAFGNCREIGRTSFGTLLQVNAEVMSCDFKIGIGSVVPHAFAGFGGGAKIILPGVCHFETVKAFHQSGAKASLKADAAVGIGLIEGNTLRLNMEEAARLVGLDIKIDLLLNSRAETVAVYAGSLDQAYPLAVINAQSHYDTPQPRGKDIVIANSYAKAAESESGLEIAIPSVREEGGTVILVANAPEGHVSHYLGGPWGSVTEHSFQMRCGLPRNVERLIIFSQYPDLTMYGYFAQPEKVKIVSDWGEVLRSLPSKAKVAVYPNADIQYCSQAPGSKVLVFADRSGQ